MFPKRGPFQKEKSLPVPSCFSKVYLHHLRWCTNHIIHPNCLVTPFFPKKDSPKKRKISAKTSPNSRHWAPVTTYFPLGMMQGAILASARWERPKFWSTWITCRDRGMAGVARWQSPRIFQHTRGTYPDPQPTVYEGIPFSWGFRDSWGMLRGYVGVFLHRGEKGGTRMVAFSHVFVGRLGGWWWQWGPDFWEKCAIFTGNEQT